ncbi:MAG: response regulator transcription factor, partial [Longimicrobiales bacterium]
MTPEPTDPSSSARAYSTSDPARILIVDDHAIVRHGLARLIDEEDDLEVCAEAGSFGEALDALEREDPDLVVVDLALEGADGLELIKRIAAEDGAVRSLVLSMYDESLYAERSLRAGASGYVMKEEATRTVVT